MGNCAECLACIIMAPGNESCMAMLTYCGAASGLMRSMSDRSSVLVPPSDQRVNTVLSQPQTMATTASNTATPRVRLTHSPAPRAFFRTANTRPPAKIAAASDVAAPAA
jgi:hypothetical protein